MLFVSSLGLCTQLISLFFNTQTDLPIATLQRIKALVIASLPTFIDLGYKFSGASIEEKSVVQQMHQVNKKNSESPPNLLPHSFLQDPIVDLFHGR